ncbi:MAG TPA: hypothetical protein VHZ26_20425 [Caulobacteraceae bacterium]|jgi:hypothetical protein|nr:hypothetical protein [Caulobacteraceae bacterium]
MRPLLIFAVRAWISSLVVFFGAIGAVWAVAQLINAHDTGKFLLAILIASITPLAIGWIGVGLWHAWLRLRSEGEGR